jgi:hypothetical protein
MTYTTWTGPDTDDLEKFGLVQGNGELENFGQVQVFCPSNLKFSRSVRREKFQEIKTLKFSWTL